MGVIIVGMMILGCEPTIGAKSTPQDTLAASACRAVDARLAMGEKAEFAGRK